MSGSTWGQMTDEQLQKELEYHHECLDSHESAICIIKGLLDKRRERRKRDELDVARGPQNLK